MPIETFPLNMRFTYSVHVLASTKTEERDVRIIKSLFVICQEADISRSLNYIHHSRKHCFSSVMCCSNEREALVIAVSFVLADVTSGRRLCRPGMLLGRGKSGLSTSPTTGPCRLLKADWRDHRSGSIASRASNCRLFALRSSQMTIFDSFFFVSFVFIIIMFRSSEIKLSIMRKNR